jgi:hypothetical protein
LPRHVLVAACASICLAIAVGVALAAPPRVGTISPRVPELRDAAVRATLVALDPKLGAAEFRVSCGWYYSPRRKVRPGLWRVSRHGLAYGVESNPANPARGHVEPVSPQAWLRIVVKRGWSGTLRLRGTGGSVSDGPTTNVCRGVPG